MKRGDLCKFVGTTGWGTLCIVVDVDVWDEVWKAKVRVLSDNGKVGCLAPAFLEVVKINNGDNSPQTQTHFRTTYKSKQESQQ